MSAIKLREGLWSVGVLNPSLRVFDIVMESKYGTSYNAYLLTGEKNVLIETVHRDDFDQFSANLREVISLEDLDYLIMNHTEPDHSGSAALLLEQCPKLTVLCTNAAKKFLSAIVNRDFPCRVVKDGDTLELGGGRRLHFLPAPLLHWPDSMFTWDPVGRTLFTCDFLGAHFCEPSMLDTGIHSRYRAAYQEELRHYFNCIFGPFKPSVLAGLDKMPPEVQMVCPSHGPCLTESLAQAREHYRQWASPPAAEERRRAEIIYASAYGSTGALARAAAQALEAAGFSVGLLEVPYTSLTQCAEAANGADLLLVGAPTINKDAPKGIWDVLACVDAINTKGRAAGAFGSFGWSGEAPEMLRTRLSQLKFKTPDKPFRVNFTPAGGDLEAMAQYARDVAALL